MAEHIVTIDDGGWARAVNVALAECIDAGTVNDVSVMATGPHAAGACQMARDAGIRVAAHLDASEGPFLRPGSDLPKGLAAWAWHASRLAERVRDEWAAQIERLLSLGVELTALNSHRHLHHLPPLAAVTLDLASEYQIPRVRTAVLPDRMRRLPAGAVLDFLGRRLRRRARARGLETVDAMLGFGQSGAVDRAYLERYRPGPGAGVVELVLHPAAERVWSAGQPGELALMRSEWFRRRFGQRTPPARQD